VLKEIKQYRATDDVQLHNVYANNLHFMLIILAWAEQRGFHTAKAGRPDTYRAGKNI
jgi:hypothetical protein